MKKPSLVNTTKGKFLLHISEEDSKRMSSQNNREHKETKTLKNRWWGERGSNSRPQDFSELWDLRASQLRHHPTLGSYLKI